MQKTKKILENEIKIITQRGVAKSWPVMTKATLCSFWGIYDMWGIAGVALFVKVVASLVKVDENLYLNELHPA